MNGVLALGLSQELKTESLAAAHMGSPALSHDGLERAVANFLDHSPAMRQPFFEAGCNPLPRMLDRAYRETAYDRGREPGASML